MQSRRSLKRRKRTRNSTRRIRAKRRSKAVRHLGLNAWLLAITMLSRRHPYLLTRNQ